MDDLDDAPRPMDLSFLEMNPPDHTRLRRLVSPAFSPKQMTAWTPRIEKRTQQLLDAVSGPFDLVCAYANPLPIAVISDLLGMPHERADDFARYGRLSWRCCRTRSSGALSRMIRHSRRRPSRKHCGGIRRYSRPDGLP
jgi:cytochrome P450